MSRLSSLRRTLSPRSKPHLTQVAALCWRLAASDGDGDGAPRDGRRPAREVLLVSSSAGRWILPKGWPMVGRSDGRAALQEAWEEGGVLRGKVARRPLGEYLATKRTPQGDDVPCLLRVFGVEVRDTADAFPEAHRRQRLWVSPGRAAELVEEDGLREILRAFEEGSRAP